MTRGTMVKVVVAALIVLLAYAWYDGGREPMHQISEPVVVPGAAR